MKKKFAVFGLGRFGFSVVEELIRSGADVIAVDRDPMLIQRISPIATVAVQADVNDAIAMQELGLDNVDGVMISMAMHLEDSIMAIMTAKEAGVPMIWVKARDEVQQTIFSKLGADRVMIPERDAGISVAKNMVSANLLGLMELTEQIRLVEIAVKPEWDGYSLRELDLRRKYKINVIAIREGEKVRMDLGPERKLEAGTSLYVIGDVKAINKLGN